MDSNKKKYSNPNPKLYANFLSRLIFSWLFPLFKHGKNHELEARDLYNVLPEDSSENLGNRLERFWIEEVNNSIRSNTKPKLWKAIVKALGWSYMKYGINMFLLNIFVRVTQPLVLEHMVTYFYHNSTTAIWDVYACTSCFVILIIFQVFLNQHANFGLSVTGMRLRIACSSLIYRKMTKLSCSSVRKISGGSILNLLSSDVTKFETLFISLHYIWIIPLQAIIIACLIWQRIGIATFVGIGFMTMTTIPIQFLLGRIILKLRMKAAVLTDRRILIIGELISGIRAIKMSVWEKPFERLVSKTRRKEINLIKMYSYLKGISLATLMFTNLTTLFFTLLVYVLQGNVISANIVYVITYYYYYLRLTLTYHFPNSVNFLAESSVSLKRIEKFLLLNEVQKALQSSNPKVNDKICILIKDVNAKWSEKSIVDTLNNINVCISPKKLYAVVGPIGAGKSSFLKLILGELCPKTGELIVSGNISYASQEPWLFTGSIRNNIIFGEPYEETKYRRIIKVCALEEDFKQLPYGDKTLVGERGASLSGGQCARVNFARAIYRDADIYLFDDPLSIVDAEVSKHLFCDCINGLLKDKTRILVTHQMQYLRKADAIIFFNNSQVQFQGSFTEFQNTDMLRYISLDTEKTSKQERVACCNMSYLVPYSSEDECKSEGNREEPQENEELIEKRNIKNSIYWKYFKAGDSYFLFFATILCYILAQALLSSTTYWIAYWTQYVDKISNMTNLDVSNATNDTSFENFDSYMALEILGGLTLASILMCLISNILLFKTCMKTNKYIHKNMLIRLLKAPMYFFESNPSGRILNRFAKDTGAADKTLPVIWLQFIQWCSIVVGNLLQLVIVNWLIIFPLFVILFLYSKIKNIYLATAQNIKRLESIARSPVFSHVNSSLDGLLTIRSCGAEAILCREFDEHQDNHTSAQFLVIASSIAFGFWIDAISLLSVVLVSYSIVFFIGDGSMTASYVGLTITQVIGLCDSMQSCMKNYGDAVAQMTNVERMFQFTKLEQEEVIEENEAQLALRRPPILWPTKGEIKFEKVSLKYSENGEPALKDLNFTIKAGMKVGIVGRTGAGKSSLISALFRLVKIEGSIYIDDINIQSIGIEYLREKISIIPQEPVIFTTSVRKNLDAFGRFDDSLLWSALDAVELKQLLPSLDAPLDHGGAGLSVGQRQLLCLARTILENNHILVLDEATANVDLPTDQLIRHTIFRHFGNCTVITFAHRLNTILDSDMIVVMDKGRIVEYDKPRVLIKKANGYLRRMVEQTGRDMAE